MFSKSRKSLVKITKAHIDPKNIKAHSKKRMVLDYKQVIPEALLTSKISESNITTFNAQTTL